MSAKRVKVEKTEIEKKGFAKISKSRKSQKLHAAKEHHTSFQVTNVQHVESLTKKWIEMASVIGIRLPQ